MTSTPLHKSDRFEHVLFESRAEWRRWLKKHHTQTEAIWAVTWKKNTSGPYVPYEDLRDEALCWGWIDSLRRRVDDEQTRLLIAPRRAKSGWSAVNKKVIERLIADKLVQKPGLDAIARAKADGSWEKLDEASTLVLPDDLKRALMKAKSLAAFEAFPPSSRRAILEWIAAAKALETRQKRLNETARLAALGLRANSPEAKGK